MPKSKSYDQKAAVYFAHMKICTTCSVTSVYHKYKGTAFGMRKQDILPLLKNLKLAIKYNNALDKSNMRDIISKKKLQKLSYQYAKKGTSRYKKNHPLKSGQKRPTLQTFINNTFARDFNMEAFNLGEPIDFGYD